MPNRVFSVSETDRGQEAITESGPRAGSPELFDATGELAPPLG